MKTRDRSVLSLGLLLAFTAAMNARSEAFSVIAQENAFRLNRPRPEIIATTPKVERYQITLLGITTILGRSQALLKIQPVAKSAVLAQSSFVLAEGESQLEVMVVEIDAKTATVRLNNAGLEQTLGLGL